MTLSEILTRWFDVRPGEGRRALFSFLGAYSVISFLILARALREALYLSTFDVRTLPYMIIAVAVLSLPTAALFGRMMGSGNLHRAFVTFIVGFGVVIAALQVLTGVAPAVANVTFYLVTVLGASLLTSGFWMVTSEQFSIRQAKRLFGLIGAGGTLGAMITGISLSFLTSRFTTVQLALGLDVLLAMTLVFQMRMPKLAPHHHHQEGQETGIREGLALVFSRPHLRNIATLVFVATRASTILDWQFKEIVSANFLTDTEGMASFFGAFYGWTGLIALLIQVFVAARLLSMGGIATSLSVLPVLLLVGPAGMLLISSLLVATLARGADATLRKSLHRSVLEFLYVPVPVAVRRKTKTFIDSVVDSTAGGVGAGLLFVWVTWAGLPSPYLSLFVGGLAVVFIYVGIKTGAQYTRAVRDRLAGDGEELDTSDFDRRNLLTVTLTRLDLANELAKVGVTLDGDGPTPGLDPTAGGGGTTLDRILASDPAVVERALDECDDWDEAHVEALTRLLARTDFFSRAARALRGIGEPSVRHVIDVMLDEHADFVIRRRIPRILAEVNTAAADQALLDGLAASRFEVRYRAAIALSRRRKSGLANAEGDWQAIVWEAVAREVSRDRPIWELQKILDESDVGEDDFVGKRVDVRGELSLEHTFRQLSLVLDAEAVKMAFHGIVMGDENLKSLSLEYLEQILPPDIRDRLWPFIGDISDYQRQKFLRSVDEVVDDLSRTGATLFGGAADRRALHDALQTHEDRQKDEDADD